MISNTSARTVVVNSAFLQDIKDDNLHLTQLLTAASETLQVDRADHLRIDALAELLSQLRDQLATHFSLEEFFGYFEDAENAAPHLSAQADFLRKQHTTLYITISELAKDAELLRFSKGPLSEGLKRLIDAFQTFYVTLMEHEENERDLIFRSFYDDIGVGD